MRIACPPTPPIRADEPLRPPQWLDELRARTAFGVIGRTTKLTKAGREFRACCPFHNEKSPSFYVNDDKAFYHCFGCGVHGDAIRWMTDQRGLPFMEAVKELAADSRHGGAPSQIRARRKQAEQRDQGLHDVMAAAQDWFAEPAGRHRGRRRRARYLANARHDAQTAPRFGFGPAPEGRQAS